MIYGVDPETGRLRLIGRESTQGAWPDGTSQSIPPGRFCWRPTRTATRSSHFVLTQRRARSRQRVRLRKCQCRFASSSMLCSAATPCMGARIVKDTNNPLTSEEEAPLQQRPNILFLMADQMQARVFDPDHPCLTPNLDRLAAKRSIHPGLYAERNLLAGPCQLDDRPIAAQSRRLGSDSHGR